MLTGGKILNVNGWNFWTPKWPVDFFFRGKIFKVSSQKMVYSSQKYVYDFTQDCICFHRSWYMISQKLLYALRWKKCSIINFDKNHKSLISQKLKKYTMDFDCHEWNFLDTKKWVSYIVKKSNKIFDWTPKSMVYFSTFYETWKLFFDLI